MADNVLADVCRGGQAVQPVEQLHARDVMLPGLLVQLIPKHTSYPLDRGETVCTPASPAPFPLWQAGPAPSCRFLPTFAM